MKQFILSFLLLVSTTFIGAQQNELLEKYRSMAIAYNHDLKAAAKNISAGIELEKSAKADLKPKLSGDVTFQYTGRPLEFTLIPSSTSETFSLESSHLKYGASLSLLQPIYTGGRIQASIQMAQQQHSLATNQEAAFRSEVCYQTDMQYWNTVARAEIVEVCADHRSSIASLAKTIQERVEIGFIDSQDQLMAEVKLNEAEYQLSQAKSNFKTSLMALNSLIGVDLTLNTETDQSIPLVCVTDGIWQSDNIHRPEIRMAYDHIKIAESSSKLINSQFKPQLYVGIDGNYSSPGYDFRSDLDPNYAVYAKLSVPIFEWGKRSREKRASSFKIGMAQDQLNKVTDQVNLEVQSARISLQQSIERVELTRSSLEKAYENERKALERYREGKISVVEVIEAQTYRQTSQINHIQAKISAQGFYSELIKALHRY